MDADALALRRRRRRDARVRLGYNSGMRQVFSSALAAWLLLVPWRAAAQGLSDAADDEALACEAAEDDCDFDEVCKDSVCVPLPEEVALEPLETAEPPPKLERVPIVAFIGSLAGGPMLFAFGADPMAAAVIAGGGIRINLSRTFSIPIRLDVRYVLTDAGEMYSYQPSAGIRMTLGDSWLSLTGGIARWPLQRDRNGEAQSMSYADEMRAENYPFDEYGGHIAVRFGWSYVAFDGGIDIFKTGTIQYLALGLAL